MSYRQKEKAKTLKDRELAIEHLKETIKLDEDKAKEHEKAAKSHGYDPEYNKAHAKEHKADAKGAKKLMKAYVKINKKKSGSYDSDTVKKAINSRGGVN